MQRESHPYINELPHVELTLQIHQREACTRVWHTSLLKPEGGGMGNAPSLSGGDDLDLHEATLRQLAHGKGRARGAVDAGKLCGVDFVHDGEVVHIG